MSTSRILIIGGGISGLALGQTLSRTSIPFTIFERDPSASFRPQGYRIGHNLVGNEALKTLLAPEVYEKVRKMGVGEEDRGLKQAGVRADAVTGELLAKGGPVGGQAASFGVGKGGSGGDEKGQAPVRAFTSDRTVIRSLLTLGIEDHISYGKKYSSFSSNTTDSTVTVTFEDGTAFTGALLIGADGVRSKVYTHLLSQQSLPPPIVLDLEVRAIYGKTILTPDFEKVFPEEWRKGMSIFRDPIKDDKILFMDPVIFNNKAEDLTSGKINTPANYLYWVFAAHPDDYNLPDEKLLSLKEQDAVDLSLKMTSHWHPNLRKLFENQEISETAVLRLASAPPEIPARDSHPIVTIMGDAVHPMSPAGGSGANTALFDAATLGELLKAEWEESGGNEWREGGIKRVVAEYEEKMRIQGGKALEGSFKGMEAMMGGKKPGHYKPIRL